MMHFVAVDSQLFSAVMIIKLKFARKLEITMHKKKLKLGLERIADCDSSSCNHSFEWNKT